MVMNNVVSLIVLFFVVFLPHVLHGQEKTINILYTGGMKGQLEPCGCSPKTDFGGLARLSGFLAAHGKGLSPYVLVDAGNFSPEDTPQGRLKVDAMLKSFGIMNYDAVAFMLDEQAFPDTFIASRINEYAIPVLSHQLPFNQTISIARDDFVINVGVGPANSTEGELAILLTDHPHSALEDTGGWDVVISSSGEELEDPVKVKETVFVSGYPRGEKLGILTLRFDEKERVKSFHNTWVPLGSDVEEDPVVRDVLDDYNAKTARLYAESERPPAGDTYLGVARCAECHQLFEESWKKTRHAAALASLEQVGKSGDPECIICHVVGFGEKGGFFSMETTPELANVQCEECHGLDREHINDYSRPMKAVTGEVCLKCHTKENSPDFDYPLYLKKIIH